MKRRDEKLISYKFRGRTALRNKLPNDPEKSKIAPGPCQSGWYHNSLVVPHQERVHNPEHANNRCQLSTLGFSKPLHLECCCFLPITWQQREAACSVLRRKQTHQRRAWWPKNFLNSTINDQILITESKKHYKFQDILTNIILFHLNSMPKTSQTPRLCYTVVANSVPGSILEQADFPVLCLGYSPSSNLLISSNCLD